MNVSISRSLPRTYCERSSSSPSTPMTTTSISSEIVLRLSIVVPRSGTRPQTAGRSSPCRSGRSRTRATGDRAAGRRSRTARPSTSADADEADPSSRCATGRRRADPSPGRLTSRPRTIGLRSARPRQDEPAADRGDEHDREDERQQQRDDHRRRDRADELAEDAADEQHRREHDDGRQRAGERGATRRGRSRADRSERRAARAIGSSRLASIDSEITIASSTSSPSVRISPNSVIVLSE